MGWPDNTKDYSYFYPTSVLETGSDILFFWVARMVMLGIELTNKIPFNKILLHGLIRDSHGKKMSKSVGNVIDPIDVIEGISIDKLVLRVSNSNMSDKEIKRGIEALRIDFPRGIGECGADALRFGLCCYCSGVKDVNLDVLRIEGYRKMCNKIWNAYKFMEMCVNDSNRLGSGLGCSGLDSNRLDSNRLGSGLDSNRLDSNRLDSNRLEGVSDKDSGLEGVSNSSKDYKGLSNKDILGGVSDSNKDYKGLSNSNKDYKGLSNSNKGYKGVSNSSYEQHPSNYSTNEQHPSNYSTNEQQSVSNNNNNHTNNNYISFSNTSATLSDFYKILKDVCGKDCRSLIDTYVLHSGILKITIFMRINTKKNKIDLCIKQKSTSTLSTSINKTENTTTTIRCYETEGVFDHTIPLSGTFSFYYHTRTKKSVDKSTDLSVLWIRIDPDMLYLHDFTLLQPDYMFV
ncbi:valine--tRNA ligase, partial [Hamiltosporidium magnivora]